MAPCPTSTAQVTKACLYVITKPGQSVHPARSIHKLHATPRHRLGYSLHVVVR
jgi:hypothetical protein